MMARPWIAWLLVSLPMAAGTPEDAWRALDAAKGDLGAATEATDGMSESELAVFLRKGRAYASPEVGRVKVDLRDGAGTESWGYIEVPSSFKPGGGVILLLHGLGDIPENLMRMYRTFSEKEGYVLAAPRATALAKEVEEEDEPQLRMVKPFEWWSYKSHGLPMRLLSEVKRRLDVDEDRVILDGYSMGGFGAWNIGMRFSDRFAGVVAYAGGISRREWYVREDRRPRELLVNLLHAPVFFLHGDADLTVPIKGDRLTKRDLEALGYDFVWREVHRASHMLPVGDGSALHGEITSWIRERRREPAPRHVVHVAHDLDHGVAHWLRVDEMDGDTALVDAEWTTDDALRLETSGVRRLTVFVPEGEADEVRVTWNGRESRAKPTAGRAVLLESWLLHEDRGMVWPSKLVLGGKDDRGEDER